MYVTVAGEKTIVAGPLQIDVVPGDVVAGARYRYYIVACLETRFAHTAATMGDVDLYFAPDGTAPALGELRE